MSDYNSGLPVRSEADGLDERLQTKLVDASNPDTQQMEVDTDGNAHTESHGNDPAGTDRVQRLSEEGHTSVSGIHDGATNTDPANIALIGHARDATPGDTQSTERLTSIENGAGDVRALDMSLHDESGEAYSASNPLPVSVGEAEGTEVVDHDESVDLAKDASGNHDYTPAAELLLDCVEASGSGKARFELQRETGVATGVFDTIDVKFNSTANPNVTLEGKKRVKVAAGVILRVVKTNLDNQPQSIYSTVYGVEN